MLFLIDRECLFMSERREEPYYENLGDLAKDTAKLIFELLRDRVLRFDLNRTLEINTFFLNYFLLQNFHHLMP